ncbi:LuxR C-terminal-related transcriptional regulator [Brevundimonas sp.]|uniref:LuxR C-terminal-related transcriptional regulator n=1 Tax=Brevundimonas sp. TaxID=1871086 RepID=UPI00286ABA4D|nr:LuxR C-terminal-related transcriptional regulator [Brevundimonas sp.]
MSIRFRALSAREQDVAALPGAGQTGTRTAELLGISPRMVDIYRSQLLKKLAVPTVASLASFPGRARTGEGAAIEVRNPTQGDPGDHRCDHADGI